LPHHHHHDPLKAHLSTTIIPFIDNHIIKALMKPSVGEQGGQQLVVVDVMVVVIIRLTPSNR